MVFIDIAPTATEFYDDACSTEGLFGDPPEASTITPLDHVDPYPEDAIDAQEASTITPLDHVDPYPEEGALIAEERAALRHLYNFG